MGELPIYSKLAVMLQNLKDLQMIPDKFVSAKSEEFAQIQKLVKAKVDSFSKSTQNFYVEWIVEYNNNSKLSQQFLQNLAKNKSNQNDLSRILRNEHQELKQKIREYESMFKEKTSLADSALVVEAKGIQTEFALLKEKYKSLLDLQECTTRRLRKLMDYCNPAIEKKAIYPQNSLFHTLKSTIIGGASSVSTNIQGQNKVDGFLASGKSAAVGNGVSNNFESASPVSKKSSSTAMNIEEDPLSKEKQAISPPLSKPLSFGDSSENRQEEQEDDDDYECFCGGSQFNYFQQSFELSLANAINNPVVNSFQGASASTANGPGAPSNGTLTSSSNGVPSSGIALPFNPLTLTNEITSLKEKVEDLSDENVTSKQEIEKLRMQLKNQEEGLFNSSLFKNLVEQGQELIKYIAYLKQQLTDSNNKVLEIERERCKEVSELMAKHHEEKEKLLQELSQLKEVEVKFFQSEQFKENLTQYDLNNFTKPLQQRIDECVANSTHLLSQNTSLQVKLDSLQKRYDEESKKGHDLLTKNIKLEEEQLILRTRIPGEFVLESIVFRHHQHQEFILEMEKIIDEKYPALKEQFNDMVLYVKSRDSQVDMIESKFKDMKNKEEQQKKSIESYLQELQITSNGYVELNKQQNSMLASLKAKDEEISTIMHEKNLEKTLAEKEKVSFNVQMRLDNETISKLNLVLEEYREKIKSQDEIQAKLEEQLTLLQGIRDVADSEVEDYLKTIEQLVVQLKYTEDRFASLELSLNQSIKENEKLKLELQKQEDSVKEKSDVIKTLEEKGDTIMRIELQKYREMIICSVCQTKEQKLIISKCNHLYCKECLENSIKNRNRQCPQCRTRFGEGDIKEIFWN